MLWCSLVLRVPLFDVLEVCLYHLFLHMFQAFVLVLRYDFVFPGVHFMSNKLLERYWHATEKLISYVFRYY